MAVVAVAACGRPLAEAYAEKLKAQYRAIAPAEENALNARLSAAEEEIRELKKQLGEAKETTDFAMRLIDSVEKRLPEKTEDRVVILRETAEEKAETKQQNPEER